MDLGAVKPPTTLEVNRKCDFGGYEITVKKMEVTPLLWSLYLDYDEAMKVYEDEKTNLSTQVRTMAWIFMPELVLTRCAIKMERF